MLLGRTLQAVFFAQAKDALKRVNFEQPLDMSQWVQPTFAAVKPVALQLWQQGAIRTLAKLPSQVARRSDVRSYALGNAIAFGVSKALLGGGNFSLLYNKKIVEAVDAAVFQLSKETLATATKDANQAISDLRALLREGLPRSEAPELLARKIAKIFASPSRALRIAITESNRLIHAGQMLAAKESGLVWGKAWLASRNSCGKCKELDGTEVELDQPFIVLPTGGVYAVVHHPPLHANCQCTYTNVL